MLKVIADLHIHSVLSPCAENDMKPENIFLKAKSVGIQLLAITDHNSAENVNVFMRLAKEFDIKLLPGMEVQTVEEVHLLTYFDDIHSLMDWQSEVYNKLPFNKNDSDIFGEEYLLDSRGNIRSSLERSLLESTYLGINEVKKEVEGLGGVCIPAHIDRPRYGLVGQLGILPSDIGFEGVEISPYQKNNEDYLKSSFRQKLGVICSSDAHYINDIGKGRTIFYLKEINLNEIRLALRSEKGRRIEVI